MIFLAVGACSFFVLCYVVVIFAHHDQPNRHDGSVCPNCGMGVESKLCETCLEPKNPVRKGFGFGGI
jgi:hypothetical protein